MPQFSLTVVPTLVQGLRCVVENHEIPENNDLPITNQLYWHFLCCFGFIIKKKSCRKSKYLQLTIEYLTE